MGNIQSINKIHFEGLTKLINGNPNSYVLINTLPDNEQSCLILNTVDAKNEVTLMNDLLRQDKTRHIIVYGRNYADITIHKKYNQLKNLGFKNISVYFGGMFEWLLLQEVYGEANFQTNNHENDILKYK